MITNNGNGKRRKERILSGIALVVIAVILALTIPQLLHQSQIVRYKESNAWLEATPVEVCPGEVFTFPVSLIVSEAPAYIRIVESWCRSSDGVCLNQFSTTNEIALLEPLTISATARRTVPDLPPGDWQLQHINESHVTGKITVTGYGVRVTVKDCK